jgi:hypothetical protein
MGNGDAVIVLTERRRLVDDTGTGRVGDIGVGEDSERAVLVLSPKRQHWFDFTTNEEPNRTHLLGKVIEHGNISPSNHILALETADLLELWLLLVLFRVGLFPARVLFVDGAQQVLEEDEVLIPLKVVDLDIGEVGVDAEAEVGWEGIRGGRPGEEGGRGVVDEGECDGDYGRGVGVSNWI